MFHDISFFIGIYEKEQQKTLSSVRHPRLIMIINIKVLDL